MLALAEALETLGKQVRRVIPSPLPPRYEFLDPTHVDRGLRQARRTTTATPSIVLDTGTWNQLADVADFVRESPAEKVVIDHHRTQDDLGRDGVRGRRPRRRPAGWRTRAITALDVPLSPMMARNLFVALAWDTGWFRHPNTTPATFALGRRLVAAGAEPDRC